MQSAARLRQDLNKMRYVRYPEMRQETSAFQIRVAYEQAHFAGVGNGAEKSELFSAKQFASTGSEGPQFC